MKRKVLLLGSVFSLAATALATNAIAQTQQIETVVVTAQKRAQDIQKVPIAITAVSGNELKQGGIRQPSDLGRIVPSLTMAQTPSTSTGFFTDIRGQVASDVILNINQAVGTYEDGVNIPHPEGTNGAFFDLERVEVLRGPQGTLYGRNTTGGAVNIITKGADFNGYHGFAGAEYGNYKDWKVNGAINIPLIEDKLAVRVAAQHWGRDGFGSSLITGQKLGAPHDDNVARVSVLFTPRSDLTVDLRGEFINMRRTGDLIVARGYDPSQDHAGGATEAFFETGNPTAALASFGTTTYDPVYGTYTNHDIMHNNSEIRNFERLHTWHFSSNITWNATDHFQVKSITGYHSISDYHVVDLDATPFQIGEIGVGVGQLQPVVGSVPFPGPHEEKDRFISQELDFSGDLFDGGIKWLFGAFYSDDKGSGAQPSIATPALFAFLSTFCNVGLHSCNQGTAANPILDRSAATGNPNYFPEFIFSYDQKSVTDQSWAIFTQNDIQLRDDLTLTVGGRYTTDKLGQNISTWGYDASPYTALDPFAGRYICPLVSPSPSSTTSTICDVNQSAKFTGYSYLVSLNWQMNENTLFYVKTSQGYRGGALQARAAFLPPARPETAHDYELGMKGTFFDHRLQTNIDVYETLYANKQQTQVIPGTGVIPIPSTPIVNAASAKIKGFEAEVLAIPVDNVTLSGTLTYFDGHYKNYPNALTPAGTLVNASGFALPEPKWRYSISARYDMSVLEGNLGIQADWAWHSATPVTALSQDPFFPALQNEFFKAVGILNARIDYQLPDMGGWKSGWSVGVFSTNLLNKHYQIASLDAAAFGVGMPTGITQEPRMFGIQIRKSFGE